MIWGLLTLVLAIIFAGAVSLYLHRKTNRLKFLGFFLASVTFLFAELAGIFSYVSNHETGLLISQQIVQWGRIYSLALVLSSLLLFVRESKPEFSQFPLFYAVFPLGIVFSYLLVIDTILVKYWLIDVYMGGAVATALLIYGIYAYRNSIYITSFCGSFLFLITYLIYLFIPDQIILIYILLALSILTTFSGYLVVDKTYATS